MFRTALLFLALLCQPARALNDPFSAPAVGDTFSFSARDKQLHIAVGYGLAFTSTSILTRQGMSRTEALLWSSLGVFTLSFVKELALDGEFSRNDIAFSLFGAALSAGVVLTFDL